MRSLRYRSGIGFVLAAIAIGAAGGDERGAPSRHGHDDGLERSVGRDAHA